MELAYLLTTKNIFFPGSSGLPIHGIQGTGLGLTIVKRYVDLLHGSISFKSDIDKGTTFDITMPRINGRKNVEDGSV